MTIRPFEDDQKMTEAFKLWFLRWEPTEDEIKAMIDWSERQRAAYKSRYG